jgi:hypothetical protein
MEYHQDGGHSYRLSQIIEIKRTLEEEIQKRCDLSNGYRRSVKIISGVDNALAGLSLVVGAAGVGLLSTIVAAPVVIGMEAVTLVAGVLSIIGKQVSRKLSLNAEKHEKIRLLAEAKLSTINDHISKALQDNRISDEEHSLILSELNKFRQMKEEIRTKVKMKSDELEQGADTAYYRKADKRET